MRSAFKTRVVSYNVLSSHLASPKSYPMMKPEDLDPANRLELVLKKLEAEIKTTPTSIVCLQEVSYDWAGALHTFFANHGYHMVTGLYGKHFNGYMGVALAWPTETYEAVGVDISRLSDKRSWPREPEPEAEKPSFQPLALLSGLVQPIQNLFTPKESNKPWDHWEASERKFNVVLTATLKDRQSESSFAVGCYHMPCAFYAPMIMTIHSELAAKHVQTIAGDKPYVFAGDWNFKPGDAQYKLLTTGQIDPHDPAFPEPKFDMVWEPTIHPMRSAYATAQTKEPDFTNYAPVRDSEDGECFIDTLDYIFLSPHWKVTDVLKIPHRDEVTDGPFPNLQVEEPSDHVLIAANLELDPEPL